MIYPSYPSNYEHPFQSKNHFKKWIPLLVHAFPWFFSIHVEVPSSPWNLFSSLEVGPGLSAQGELEDVLTPEERGRASAGFFSMKFLEVLASAIQGTREQMMQLLCICMCIHWPDKSYASWALYYCKPFPPRILLSTWFWSISTPEKLFSLSNLKQLTVPHLPRKMDMINRSGTDFKSWLKPSRSANFLPGDVYFIKNISHISGFSKATGHPDWLVQDVKLPRCRARCGATLKHLGGERNSYMGIYDGYWKCQTYRIYMDVEPKIGGFYPQNGWFISWKSLVLNGWFGGKFIFLETPIWIYLLLYSVGV